MSWRWLARARVPLGFACGALVLWLAAPTRRSLALGAPVAIAGEALRVWAAGHLEKNREVTASGPYRYLQHPLYAGSALMGLGLALASAHAAVAAIVATYVAITFSAAVRTERRFLAERFGETYVSYREGRASVERRFSWDRVWRNHEYRAMLGVALVIAILLCELVLRPPA